MIRPRVSKLNLRNLFVAVLIVFAFALAWISIPARAGLDSIASGATPVGLAQQIIVERTAVVDPMTLRPPTSAAGPHSRPLRVRDPAAYRQRKAAMASGTTFPEVPSILTVPLATTPTVLNNFV